MRAFILPVLLAVLGSGAAVAHAQPGPGADIDLQTFRPAMDSRGYITVNASSVLGHKEVSFGMVTSWGRNLLRLEDGEQSYRVEHILSPTLVGALGLRWRQLALELGMSLPLGVMYGDRDPDWLGAPGDPNDELRFGFDGQGVGDLAVHSKLRLRRARRGPGLALMGSVLLPTASAPGSWLGSATTLAQVTAVLDHESRRLRWSVNAGARLRTGGVTRFEDDMELTPGGHPQPFTRGVVAVGNTLPFGAAIAYALAPQRFDVIAEVFGELPLAGENYLPMEAVGGIKVYLARNSYLTLGAGTGLARGRAGSPDLRAFIGIVFEPSVGDRDGDGIPDHEDACPDEPEDFDGFEDADGCPDPDNDRDGIPDVDDQCPDEPEDFNGIEDEDGCPDNLETDRDGDGIPDHEDACPDEPEDFDGFEDEDGCPDPDNDGDGILDEDDMCPDEPETVNGFEDEDGCPDRSPVAVSGSILTVFESIHFEYDSAVIKEESHPILRVVARTLQMHPEIVRLEVQGHTDERGGDRYNLRLSQARAESVVAFLVAEGVASRRLSARGYGKRVPLDPRSNEQAWARNRRVEFVIQERSTR